MDNKELDAIIERFEDAWNEKDPPDIEGFLPQNRKQRERILPELVMTELELNLKAGNPVRVEDYLERFPALTGNESVLVRLVTHEMLIRHACDKEYDSEDFFARFPSIRKQLEEAGSSRKEHRTKANARKRDLNQLVNNRYQLKEVFAKGGLGKIWRAYDQTLNRDVALKEVKEDRAQSESIRKRLDREALITGSLEHPGIIPVHDRGVFDDGCPYYAMRMVDGITLSKAISEYHKSKSKHEKSRELKRLLSRFVDVCNTIDYAHSKAVIHRDLKPANILIGSYGETIVADWGLAKPLGVDSELENSNEQTDPDVRRVHAPKESETDLSTEFTRDGDIVGSIGFMSPEQFAGDIRAVSYRSDVYALGAILFNILSNKRPSAESNDVVANCPAPLVSIATKAMSKLPSDRYESPRHIAAEIERFQNFDRVSAHQESLKETAVRKFRKSPGTSLMVAGSILLLTAVSVVAAILINAEKTKTLEIETTKRNQIREVNRGLEGAFQLSDENTPDSYTARQLLNNLEIQSTNTKIGEYSRGLFLALSMTFARKLEDYELGVKLAERAIDAY